MFDTLLGLPLFQGLGRNDLTRILESTRLEFETIEAGAVVLRQDQACNGLTFVLNGDVEMTTMAADRSWGVVETLTTPAVVGLEVLYGSMRTHRHTLKARTQTCILFMDKRAVGALTSYFEVFQLNVLNLLTSRNARRDQMQWLPAETSLEGRIRTFMRSHIQRPAGKKEFRISLRMLGLYLGEDKRYISRAIHKMQDAGLLTLGRRNIVVHSFEELLKAHLS